MNNIQNIPYEDVQTTTMYITQCASNVLTVSFVNFFLMTIYKIYI